MQIVITCHPKIEIFPILQFVEKNCPGQSGPPQKNFRFSNIDCVGSKLKLSMTVRFSVRRRFVRSKTKKLYTHSLTFSKISSSKLGLSLSKVRKIFPSRIKSWFFKVVDFFYKRKGQLVVKKISRTSFMLFGHFIFYTIKNFERMINRKTIFLREKKILHVIL